MNQVIAPTIIQIIFYLKNNCREFEMCLKESGDSLGFQFLERFPEHVEKFCNDALFDTKESFWKYLDWEKKCVLTYLQETKMTIRDPFDFKTKLSLLYPNQSEIDELVVLKNEHYKSQPDFPTLNDLARIRLAKFWGSIVERQKAIINQRVKYEDLVQVADCEGAGTIRFFFHDAPYTGIAYTYEKDYLDNEKYSYQFDDGYLNGTVVEWKFDIVDIKNEFGHQRSIYKHSIFCVKEYEKGKLKKEDYFNPRGVKISKPWYRKYFNK